ncbi:MAG TPA: crosslink repair DNA glycosylase YcaQ family protein [Planctomycetota bacterium]|nr:crosslink repair DNA glycosylase YcaQ family protein [Planctomycetota bacterium]
MPLPTVPTPTARRLLLEAQGLIQDPSGPATEGSVYALIERLGFVQLDTISVVERAHHHILGTRLDAYRPALLDRLHRKGRIFEHMTHDASLIPTRWFPHWRKRFGRPFTNKWWKERIGKDADKTIAHVLERIRREGPLRSSDFEAEQKQKKSGWWEWRPQKAALEFLWRTGELAILERTGFQKVYDLTSRVLPEAHALPEPTDEAHVEWACTAALERLGVATATELAAFFRAVSVAEARAWCAEATRSGRVAPVLVEGNRAVAPLDWERRAERAGDAPARMRLLSPFDPVIRDRKRALRLFGFDYRFEAFVPPPLRKHGYYVLPLLQGEELVGRLDPKLHREKGVLEVRKLSWEGRVTKKRKKALEEALDRFAAFCGATRWTLANGAAPR